MTFPLGSLRAERRRSPPGLPRVPRPPAARAALRAAQLALLVGARVVAAGAAGAAHAQRRRPGVLDLGQRRRRCTTGPACSAPGCRTWRCFLFGYSAWWCRWSAAARLAVVAGARLRARRAVRGQPPRPRTRWRSGSAWCCCWRPAPRSNGRACTASRRCCPAATPAACSATLLGPLSMQVARLRRLGRALDRGAGGRRRRWRCASRGCASPSASARRIEALRERRRRAHASAPKTCASARRRSASATRCVEVEHELHRASTLPIVIEPPMVEVPKSERVAKERQKPLFSELPDTSCRRSTCSTRRRSAPGDRDAPRRSSSPRA